MRPGRYPRPSVIPGRYVRNCIQGPMCRPVETGGIDGVSSPHPARKRVILSRRRIMRSNEITAPQDLSAFGEELSDTELAKVNGGVRVIVIVFGEGTVVVIVQR